jgi:DNA modification methylase
MTTVATVDRTQLLQAYAEFLSAKVKLAEGDGFPCEVDEVNPLLLPHQRDVVVWAVRGGRRAIFAAFGLGKTIMQLEVIRLVLQKSGLSRGLVVCPLGVRQEFMQDAQLLATGRSPRITDAQREELRNWQAAQSGRVCHVPTFIRSIDDAFDTGIYLTNYETVRDGKLDPRLFDVVSLDEAAILRGFGGTKTFREFMKLYEGSSKYRFVATATPSPNEYVELLAYAAFLDIMDVGQAKTRFFKRDSTQADQLTLRPHQEREFWLWVASWAMFIATPSDLGHDDAGYVLPPLDIRWHEVEAADVPGADRERGGQTRLWRDTSLGIQEAAREKRDSLPARIAKMRQLLDESPDDHALLWHDLEAERHAICAAVPAAAAVWGSQDLDEREAIVRAFSDGQLQYLAGKPVMLGSGCNFQRHCHRAIFLGIGFKFSDFIQACHRIYRFLQTDQVRIDLIYTEAERGVRQILEQKWQQHNELVAQMTGLIREFGLSRAAMASSLARKVGVERREVSGRGWTCVHNDSVLETIGMADDSVDLIVTSIPFSTQYEYTPSYNDFGHSDDNRAFWQQMDFLSPQVLRVLRPGRIAAIHVKDRIAPGGLTGMGFQTVQPFHAEAIEHYTRHGFAYLGMKTVVTDVVRENNQTYRLGYTEQCKDGSRMGCGMPEYVLLFRKPPSDRSNGYADVPVVKSKDDYSLARWQLDAHGFQRSSGDRLLSPADLAAVPHDVIYKLFRKSSITEVYDYERHVELTASLGKRLPVTFMLMPPHSWHPDVWTDVARMRTLNMEQERAGREHHLCPLQFDIVDRLIRQHSMPGEEVYDPFGGIGTVVVRALKLGRRGRSCELNPTYFRDAVNYCAAAEHAVATPSLFDLTEVEEHAEEERAS